MKNILLAFVVIFMLFSKTYAQLHIRGTVKTSIIDGGEIYVEVHKDYLKPFHNFFSDIHQVSVDETGVFSLDIDALTDVSYINIVYESKSAKRYVMFRGIHLLMVDPQMTLLVNVDEKGVNLDDNQYDLIRLQVELANIWPRSKVFDRLDANAYRWEYDSLLRCLSSLEDVYAKYKTEGSIYAFSLMLNYKYFHIVARLNSIYRRAFDKDGMVINNEAAAAWQKLLILAQDQVVNIDTRYVYNYVNFLVRYYRSRVNGHDLPENDKLYQMFERIDANYNGHLRDQLLTSCYLEYMTTPNDRQIDIINTIKSNIKNEYYISLISEFENHQMMGEPVYPFRFQNNEGEFISPDSLRGKLTVIEFWFNGCQPCVWLSKQVKQTLSTYDHRNDIQLVTINVDRIEEQWIRGLQSGDYTSEFSIDLHVGKEGYLHEMLRQYNYKGFPQLMLVDKFGQIITPFAPKPTNEEGKRAFFQLLDENI